jgi:hypothetical protein
VQWSGIVSNDFWVAGTNELLSVRHPSLM